MASTQSSPLPVKAPPEPEEIARLAYTYWEERGCPDGSSDDDWYRAEEELRTRLDAGTSE
jgi:hypothetical protein